MNKISFCFLLISLFVSSAANAVRPEREIQEAHASRISKPPVIDGTLEPDVWSHAIPVSEFLQYDPDYQGYPTHRSEVRFLYDDRAVYVGAIFYDSAPDSILRQLGPRDSSLNADAFGIKLDTYNNQLDAYTFEVSASGVQRDLRAKDHTYDGVWDSKVQVHEKGWSVEMRIPYSALRFPPTGCQQWGLQIYRNVRRYREVNHWALEERAASNDMIYWGTLNGICDVQSPLRLSLTPYVSTSTNHYPSDVAGVSNFSSSFGGGMDLKYGINESFTLDMTLMPDFSQVQSDNVVKNLSAFETVYGEERPFFKESMDLFRRGGIFYSRRIGGRPGGYGRVNAELEEHEQILDNPMQSRLVNAFKVSGRTARGLAVGVFNAITRNTFAVAEDTLGLQRKLLTEPATNYNILVLDQALRNNSSAYLINTSVLRGESAYHHANVTGAGISLVDKNNTYEVNASGALSQLYPKNDNPEESPSVATGKKYDLRLQRIRGNFRFSLRHNVIGTDYDDNDMGLTQRRNQVVDRVDLNYNIYDPFWKLRNFRSRLTIRNEALYENYLTTNRHMEFQAHASNLKYLSFNGEVNFHLQDRKDFYEPRVAGRYFIRPKGLSTKVGFSTDYRNPFALDFNFNYGQIADFDSKGLSYRLVPRYRLNDHFSFVHTLHMNYNTNDIGYAAKAADQAIVFGNRDVTTVENVFSSDYILSNEMYFSFRMRQYWSKGEYNEFYRLKQDGRLEDDYPYEGNKDFN
ncbi:MAG: DUF5916 domain-containing protein, partial [Bacteroidales bacterium]